MRNPNRPLEIAAFLDQSGWGKAHMHALDGDFSTRRYARLTKTGGGEGAASAILMDADADQNTPHFVLVANMLRRAGITAPEIYADASDQGLLLLQDFGARNVGGVIDGGGAAREFYLRAAELLAQLHTNFDAKLPLPLAGRVREGGDQQEMPVQVFHSAAARSPEIFEESSVRNSPLPDPPREGEGIPLYTTDLFTTQADLFLDAYIPYILHREATEEERADFCAAWQMVLRPLDAMPKSLMLRDFMPDNLMDLADGKLGVLDFQDAGIGPVAYDLASLCEEVRRDGGFDLLPEVIAHYREKSASPISRNDLLRACTILSAQRHTRILGIIARLAAQGRKEKLDLLPRIRKHLTRILREPYLMPVKAWMERIALP